MVKLILKIRDIYPAIIFLALFYSLDVTAMDNENTLRVMTYNVRHFLSSDCDKVLGSTDIVPISSNCWPARKNEIINVINKISPDVLVVQELSKSNTASNFVKAGIMKATPINFIIDSLVGTNLGERSSDQSEEVAICGDGGEYCYIPGVGNSQKYIFYKRGSNLTFKNHASYWLPPYKYAQDGRVSSEGITDDTVYQSFITSLEYPEDCRDMLLGSKYEGDFSNNRTATLAKFEFENVPIYILNTHLYHAKELIASEVRVKQVECLHSILAELPSDIPSLIMGDFNAAQDSAELTPILNNDSGKGFYHLHPVPRHNTYNRFGKTGDPLMKVDHIFGKDIECVRSDVDAVVYLGSDEVTRFPSDHHPVWADVILRPPGGKEYANLSDKCKGENYFFL